MNRRSQKQEKIEALTFLRISLGGLVIFLSIGFSHYQSNHYFARVFQRIEENAPATDYDEFNDEDILPASDINSKDPIPLRRIRMGRLTGIPGRCHRIEKKRCVRLNGFRFCLKKRVEQCT